MVNTQLLGHRMWRNVPDYWTVSKEGLCKPNPAVGNVGSANCGPFDPNKIPVPGTGRFSGPTSETAPGDAQIDGPRCMRQRKAHRCGFYWDGISDLGLWWSYYYDAGPINGSMRSWLPEGCLGTRR